MTYLLMYWQYNFVLPNLNPLPTKRQPPPPPHRIKNIAPLNNHYENINQLVFAATCPEGACNGNGDCLVDTSNSRGYRCDCYMSWIGNDCQTGMFNQISHYTLPVQGLCLCL